MISPITDLALVEKYQDINDSTTFVFSFSPVSGNVGGYVLYYSLDNITFQQLAIRIDSSHNPDDINSATYTDGTSIFFKVTLDRSKAGILYYFKAKVVSTAKEYSDFSNTVVSCTFPTKPIGSLVYEGLKLVLNFSIPTEAGINANVESITIGRQLATQINSNEVYITGSTAYCTKFVQGEYVYVRDNANHIFWFGQVTSSGEFNLDRSTCITSQSDVFEEYIVDRYNLSFYTTVESESYTSLVTLPITESSYETIDYTFNTVYFYTLQGITIDNMYGNRCVIPAFTLDFEFAYPYLKPIYSTEDKNLSQPEWRLMKQALVDGNYYDKDLFAIPYFKDYAYTFKGYFGIAHAKIDIYVDEKIYTTIVTNQVGEFLFTYVLPYGYTHFKFQGRSANNEKFSRMSSTYRIHTVLMYTFLQILGDQLHHVRKLTQDIRTYVSLQKSPYQSFVDIFLPYTGVYKLKNEEDASFRNIARNVFNVFEYGSFKKGLRILLDTFSENIQEFDHYEIYYNYDLYQTLKSGYSFAVSQPNLSRGRWHYGISSATLTGEETDITTLLVDTRWWPVGFISFVVLLWDAMIGSETYHIYKGETLDSLYYLHSCRGTIFCDTGDYLPNTSIKPIFYNFTNLRKPTNVRQYIHNHLSEFSTRLKKNNSLIIIIYAKSGVELPDEHIERLQAILRFVIPPEIAYTLLYASDSQSVIIT